MDCFKEECRFAGSPESVAASRRFVQECIGGEEPLTEALVLVSELTANAVEHARTDFELSATVADGSIHVRVRDWAPGRPPRMQHDHAGAGGRGLHIVDVTADRWGWEVEGNSKVVWFDLRLDHHWPDGPDG